VDTRGSFPGVKAACTWIWPLHLVPSVSMYGNIPPLPNSSSWHNDKLYKLNKQINKNSIQKFTLK
jgi:hypothetical protein